MNYKKNNICVISKFLYDNDTRLQQQVKALTNNGKEVDVLCLFNKNTDKVRREKSLNIYGIVRPSRKDSFALYLWSTLRFSFMAFIKLQILSIKKYDVIVVHTLPESLVFITFIQKLFGTKILLDIRDTSVELFDSKWKSERSFLRYFVKLTAHLSCKYSNKIITASPGFEERLIERNVPKNKLTVLYNSADTNIFKFDSRRKFKKIESAAKIIYHGTIAERFGIDVAIKAMGLLKNIIPNSILNIYGFYDDEYRVKLVNLIKELELEDQVHLNEPDSLENLYNHILESDIGIVPYRSDIFMELALSTKMFEYVASGIPVVASRLRPAELVFSDDCIQYAAPNDPKELSQSIIKLCLDEKLRMAKVQNAINTHSKISSEVMSKKYLDIIQTLISEKLKLK